jgi:hypothetical protein
MRDNRPWACAMLGGPGGHSCLTSFSKWQSGSREFVATLTGETGGAVGPPAGASACCAPEGIAPSTCARSLRSAGCWRNQLQMRPNQVATLGWLSRLCVLIQPCPAVRDSCEPAGLKLSFRNSCACGPMFTAAQAFKPFKMFSLRTGACERSSPHQAPGR